MYLHEYQSKQYFARFGIQTLQGRTATTAQEARDIAQAFGVPVVVNAQAFDNQRIFRPAADPDAAEHVAQDILAMTIGGVRVRTILIEPAADVEAEYFLGIYGDRGSELTMIASTEGGREFHRIEQDHPETVIRETINPFLGVHDFQARNLANGINLPREHWKTFTEITQNLYRCCLACDATRAEINPLALTRDHKFLTLGGKLVIDDNALFRQPELAALRDVKAEHETTVLARTAGISYVRLDGKIGCIVSGAGLGMATLDLLARHATPGSGLLDLGSDIQREKIVTALHLILPAADAILFNIFTDKALCDQVATELIGALEAVEPAVPVVIRLAGQAAEQGRQVLKDAGVPLTIATSSTTEAVEKVIAAAAKGLSHVNTGR